MVDSTRHHSPRKLWLIARVADPDEGGVQTYVREVARAYAAQGRRVTLFAKSSAGPRRITDGHVELIDVGPAAMLIVYWRLFRAMLGVWWQEGWPDAMHACTWRAALPALIFPRPLVVTVHGREITRPRGGALMLLRLTLKRARRIVAVSDVTRTLLLARLPHLTPRTITAWNGVVMPPFRAPTPFAQGQGAPRLLSVCRLVPRKNIVGAVRALAGCADPLPYAIVGRGIDSIRVREAVRHAGLAEHVTMAGYVSAEVLADHYAQSDIFLHPQVALEDGAEVEGFGLSIADAMAQGLVCIVGQDGGPAELVRDGVTGFVVDGHSVDAIRAALNLVARDPALCQRIGESARIFAQEHFSWDRHCRLSLGEDPVSINVRSLAQAA